MAAGDIVSGFTTISASGSANIRPSGTAAWAIVHLVYSGAANIGYSDGSTTVVFWTDGTAGGLLKASMLVTNSAYLVVSNPSTSSSINMAYIGIIVKE
jgi:hypothetical protein